MSNLVKGITDEGWVINETNGSRIPSRLHTGELVNLLIQTYGDRLRLNILTLETELDGIAISDIQKEFLYLSLAQIGWTVGKDAGRDAVDFVAMQTPFDPVNNYLNQIKNDNNIYPIDINTVATEYLKTNNPLYDRMIKVFLLGAVARAKNRGCKHDTCLVFKSGHGYGKSTFFKSLVPVESWFSDTPQSKDKDIYMLLNTCWIYEFAELENVTTKKEAGELKALLSSATDSYRPPYGRGIVKSQRPSVFCASVNKDMFLTDETGSRRFHVIHLDEGKKINNKVTVQDRDSIWKAAVLAYEAGEKSYLNEEDEKLSEIYNQAYQRENSYLLPIASWSRTALCPSVFTTDQAITGSELKEKSQIKPSDQQLAAAALKDLGFVKKQCRIKGIKGYYWSKKEGGVSDVKKQQDNNRTAPIAAKDSIVNKLSYVLTEKDKTNLDPKGLDKRHYCYLVQSDMTFRTAKEKLVAEGFRVSQQEIENEANYQEFNKKFGN